MEELIKIISKRFKDFDIWQEKKTVRVLEVSEGNKKIDYISSLNSAIRVFEEGKKGFVHISGSSFDDDMIIENIKFSLDRSFKDEANVLPEPTMEDGGYYGDRESTLPSASEFDEKIGVLDHISGSFKKLKKIERISASGEETEITFYNSRKGFCSQRFIKTAIGIVVVAENRGDEKIEWDYKVAEDLKSIDPVTILENAYGRAINILNGTPVQSGRYYIFFDSRSAAEFLEVLAKSFIAENVYKKKTIFDADTELSEKLNISDNPFITSGSLKYYFDGEGFKTMEKRLMTAGHVTEYLYDSYFGKKLGKSSNGSSVRIKVSSPPLNSHTNIYIEPLAETQIENNFKNLTQVISVVSLIGMHLVNPVTGEFSVGFDGFISEKGEYRKAVSNVSLSGNVKDVFKNIIDMGDHLEFYGNTGSPSLLVSDIVVSGI